MARNIMDQWIPEEYDSQVVQRVNAVSAVERLARRHPMGTDTKEIPRSAGVDVESIGKGTAYGEDTSLNDTVTLKARKFGKAIRLAEEDIEDSLADVVAAKQQDWATSYGVFLDNAALGVTAEENGLSVPFTSVYHALSQTNSDTDYTASDHITPTAGPVTYSSLSTTLGLLEMDAYFDENAVVAIAHPALRAALRGVKDDQNRPIFVEGLAGTQDTLFGHELVWSRGCRAHATASSSPSGNALLVFANRDFMNLGVRSGPESIFIDGRSGTSALTDEAILKMRSRRGFAVGHEKAFSVLEVTPSV